MEMQAAERLDATFAALADPTRRAIVVRLAKGEASVNELAEIAPVEISQPAISKHLKVLERAPLKEATDWLERYREQWERRFQALDNLLDELQAKEKRHGKKT